MPSSALGIAWVTPTSGSVLSGNVSLSVRTTGPVARVTFTVDGQPAGLIPRGSPVERAPDLLTTRDAVRPGVTDDTIFRATTPAGQPVASIWDSRQVADGTHTLVAIAHGTGTHQASSSRTVTTANGVTPDTTPPTVVITTPADGATVRGTVTITARATDNRGIASVAFFANSLPVATTSATPYAVQWNTSWPTPPDDTYVLMARATDLAGNATNSDPVTVTVAQLVSDTTPPTVALTAPDDGATITTHTVVSADAADNVAVESVQLRANGVVIATPTTPPYAATWTPAGNGQVLLEAIATDTAGNQTRSTGRLVTVVLPDITPPTVTILAPTTGATLASGTWILSASASDNIGVVSVQFTVDGSAVGSALTTAPYQTAWTATAGSHTIRATAVDAAGNSRTVAVTVTVTTTPVDTTPPSVVLTSPANGASLTVNTVTLAATASDAQSGIASVQFAVDGVNVGGPHATAPYQQGWVTTNGSHTVRATATNGVGLTATSQVSVTVQIIDPPPPPPPPSGVLQPSDFILLGFYDVLTNGSNTSYAQGLTHRYVSGDLRLLMMQAGNILHEISLAGKSYGDTISSPTRQWSGFVGLYDFKGLYWDEGRQVLWSSTSYDYVADPPAPTQIYTHVLNDNQTLGAEVGPISLAGVPAKRSYGGVQPLPAWFQSAYSVGPYAVGWGGYTSLMTAGGSASMGLTFYTFDPDNLSNVKILADHTPSFNACTATAGEDRGRRISRPLNFFDGGGANLPAGRPTVLPNVAGCWLSPQADGYGRFLWGDSYYQTGCWIETDTKHGFLTILCGGIGNCWYQGSTLNFDGRIAEMHIFDPVTLGEVALGTRNACDTQPTYTTVLPLAGLNQIVIGNTTVGNAAAATYDASTKRLYVAGFQVNGSATRVYVFSVDSGDTPDVVLEVMAPFANATVSAYTTVLAASQGDLGGGVALWWRNAGNTLSGGIGPEMTGPPYQQIWDTTAVPNDDYYLHASSHATGTTAEVKVTVFNSGVQPIPGTVTITSPTDSSTVHGTILIHADTSGDLGGGLIFWWKSLDGTIQLTPGNEFHGPPYEVLFDTTQVVNGAYLLHAVTHATGDTPPIHVTVAN